MPTIPVVDDEELELPPSYNPNVLLDRLDEIMMRILNEKPKPKRKKIKRNLPEWW
jgi:hypothetical protein